MVDVEVPKAASLMFLRSSIRPVGLDLEPQCFINAGVCSSITPFAVDPKRAFREADSNELNAALNSAHVKRHYASNILAEIVSDR